MEINRDLSIRVTPSLYLRFLSDAVFAFLVLSLFMLKVFHLFPANLDLFKSKNFPHRPVKKNYLLLCYHDLSEIENSFDLELFHVQ